ncbi:PREDICTED: uncharacterized protein LOC107357301 [Acropora digitifera]|uniref:uncharacterized protein LOC107357301 n=1 Tax=Acropora digitifera TaxID=70779 RepID=UPI00077A4CE4|nr:PREDICTED: uncharacterized protein LOC107357301 [Acropora digitifera]
MSSTRGQSMNYLPSQLALPKSPESLGNSTSNSSRKNSYFNAAYEYVETGCGRTGSENAYEELENVGEESKATSVPRKKANDLYESAQQMSHRKRHITECSDVSTASIISTEIVQVKRQSCLNKLILHLILAVSVTALVLVILVIYGRIGSKCSCIQGNTTTPRNEPIHDPETEEISLQDMIDRLSAMKVKMEITERAEDIFVTSHEKQIEILNAHVFAQGKRINETANKVAAVDGVWMNMSHTQKAFESKLDSEFRLINKSMKTLSDSDSDLASLINELKVNQTITDGMRKRLSMNVSQIALGVQELTNSSKNVKHGVEKLERGQAHMSTSIRVLETKAVTRNASYNNLRSLCENLTGSLSTVNSTFHSKVVRSTQRKSPGFKACSHQRISAMATMTNGKINSTVNYTRPSFEQEVAITCSTDYARHVKLLSPRAGFYKCECRSISPVFTLSQQSMQCFLHVWECPT